MTLKYVCDDCGEEYTDGDMDWREIDDFYSRHEEDDIVAAGQCERCGALVFAKPSRWVERDKVEDALLLALRELRQFHNDNESEAIRVLKQVLCTT